MLLTDRRAPGVDISLPPSVETPLRPRGAERDQVSGAFSSSLRARLRAISGRDALLLRVGEGAVLVHRVQHVAVGLDPVGHELPVLAVPLLDAHVALALVVRAGELHG